jgi:hypothetical protein
MNDPATTSASLRALALSRTPEDGGFVPSASGPNVFHVLMETGLNDAAYSLSCFFDGATSLYFSRGGGVIGCGEHKTVKETAIAFVSLANDYAGRMTATTEYPLPATGFVRFYVRTPSATFTSETSEKNLGEKRDPAWPLFYSGHAVITRIRELGLL